MTSMDEQAERDLARMQAARAAQVTGRGKGKGSNVEFHPKLSHFTG